MGDSHMPKVILLSELKAGNCYQGASKKQSKDQARKRLTLAKIPYQSQQQDASNQNSWRSAMTKAEVKWSEVVSLFPQGLTSYTSVSSRYRGSVSHNCLGCAYGKTLKSWNCLVWLIHWIKHCNCYPIYEQLGAGVQQGYFQTVNYPDINPVRQTTVFFWTSCTTNCK